MQVNPSHAEKACITASDAPEPTYPPINQENIDWIAFEKGERYRTAEPLDYWDGEDV